MTHSETLLEQSKEVAKSFLSGISSGQYFQTIDQVVGENCTIHSLFGNLYGKLAMQRVVHGWLASFPDLSIHQTVVIGEKDLVVILWQAKGTHKGEFRGIKPSGKQVSYSGTSICRVQSGKIIEYWSYLDFQYILDQIH